jgi:hypothetical protein
MKKYAIVLGLLVLTGCSFHMDSHGHASNDSDNSDPIETITVTDTSLQPLGCSGPMVLYTSGGRYILPVDNITQINTYLNHHGDAIVVFDSADTRSTFELLGENSLARFDKLLDRVCF